MSELKQELKKELVGTLTAYNSGNLDKDDELKKVLDKTVRAGKVNTAVRWGTTGLAVTATALSVTALVQNRSQGKRLAKLEEAIFGDDQQVSNGIKTSSKAARA